MAEQVINNMSMQTQEVPAIITWMHDKVHGAGNWIKNHKQEAGAAALVGLLALGACGSDGETPSMPGTISSNTTIEADKDCVDTWAIVRVTDDTVEGANESHRLMPGGVQEIQDAEYGQTEDAAAGYEAWVNTVKRDPELFAGIINSTIYKNTDKYVLSTELQDADNKCVTPLAKQLTTELVYSTEMSGENAPEVVDVPADATNSGVNAEGQVVIASEAGISGDNLKAVEVTINGEKTYVLARCGNLAFPGGSTPNLPEGPTDNTPPTGGPTTTTIPLKHDDGIRPGNSEVPADQDKNIPDVPGQGPAGQTPNKNGYLPGEPVPTAPGYTPETPTTPTTRKQSPATTSPQPTSTLPPAPATTTVTTTSPQTNPRPTQP